ncbi:cupin domain-containing protein [Pseudonocardia kujensis]|uniref:cupin domain-containing protein n=1 Tax=Pseudonocardia kujensis TaxID=1128675 RepID=UPI001E61CB33|nr:cupin domain-containing protein [Pseudonocardia kujensis]MCE0762050.1 cupin domain-containing protein [Pseudonocardia kujensis]
MAEITTDHAYSQITKLGAEPLWRHYGDLFHPEPRSAAVPHRWSFSDLRPYMLHFTETLSLEEAERRVLMLVNPGLADPPATVNSLFAGIQIIMPGETAQAHRHTANAFRFIIEGESAYTTVNGERVHMRPGDLLLTPGWHWHDHYHEGSGPMMWLDGLDFPLTNSFEAGFFELFGDRTQKSRVPDDFSSRVYIHGRLNPVWETPQTASSPVGNYPWSETERALAAIGDDVDGSESEGVVLEYTNPWTGGPVMPTIDCRILRLRPGFVGRPARTTASTILHAVRGRATVEVGDTTFDLEPKDILAVPGWARYRLDCASTSEDAVLFAYSNRPALRALELLREEALAD